MSREALMFNANVKYWGFFYFKYCGDVKNDC